MTMDEGMGGGAPEPGAGQPGDMQAKMSAAMSKLTVGEQLIALGALIIVVFVDLIGDIIADEYGSTWTGWLVAIAALLVIYSQRFGARRLPLSFEWSLKILGYAAGLLGLRELLWGLENNIFDAGGGTILFALAYWVGTALMAFGAFRLSSPRAA